MRLIRKYSRFCQLHLQRDVEWSTIINSSSGLSTFLTTELVIKISHKTTNMTPMAQSPRQETFPLTIHTVCNLHAILGTNCQEPLITLYLLPFFFLPSPPSQSFLPFPSQLPVLSCSRSVAQASHFIRAEPSNKLRCLAHLNRRVSLSRRSFIL